MVAYHRLSSTLKSAIALCEQLATDETESHSLNWLERVYHKRHKMANFNLFVTTYPKHLFLLFESGIISAACAMEVRVFRTAE
jgi:hypothetical protein